jgi:predicted transcriptional regulator
MKKKENTLTKVEFQVMSILWDINHSACAWDIIERWEEPKPAYTTIATYLKVLYEKGFVDYFKNKGEGKTQWYVAKVTRAEYTRMTMKEVKKNFFDNSIKSMFSFFVKEENLSADDIRELLGMLEEEGGAL